MSWYVGGVGRAAALSEKLASDFAKNHLAWVAEEAIRQQAGETILTALGSFKPEQPVRVKAQGSMTKDEAGVPVYNSLTIEIEPLTGFID